MATGTLRIVKKATVNNTTGNVPFFGTLGRVGTGIVRQSNSLGGEVGDNPATAFKTGDNVPIVGTIIYQTRVGATPTSPAGAGNRYPIVFGVLRSGVPTKAYAIVDADYWDLAIGTASGHTKIPWSTASVRVDITYNPSTTELRNGKTVTVEGVNQPPITPPPSPPVTPEPEEEDEDDEEEEEEEEEETPVTPTPTGINAIIQNFLTQVLTGIRTAVTTALGQITVSIPASFGTTVTALKNVVTGLGTTISGWATEAASTVRTAVTTANTSLVTAVRTGVTAVGNAISQAINALKTALTAGITAMTTAISGALNTIGRLVQQAISGIQTALVNAYNRITGLITASLGRIRTAISTASERFVSVIERVFRQTGAILNSLVNAVRTRLISLTDTIKRQIEALTLKVGELAVDLLGDIYRSGNSLWDWIVTVTSDSGGMFARIVERLLGPISPEQLRLIRDGVPVSHHSLAFGSVPPPGLE